ncbi:MAG: hypothetical protein MRJ96_12555 [Nitrospirales bacterium]|nr:hypothetical protein [Nitrospira sp.]MDR4502274.1 hypothetical protein [Nitrospirales bacterium]
MKSKWSKVIKSETHGLAVHAFEMTELIPLLPREMAQRLTQYDEEEDREPPHDCSALQRQAFEAGKDEGKREGTAECREEVHREMQRALGLVKQVEEAKVTLLRQVEGDLLTLAFAIAKKVIHRETQMDHHIVAEQVRRIVQHLSTASHVRILAHPDEVESLKTLQSTLVDQNGETPTIRIEADATVGMGGCILQTDGLYIDATIQQQLEVIGQALELQSEPHESSLPASSS